jgi:hypothetical protein
MPEGNFNTKPLYNIFLFLSAVAIRNLLYERQQSCFYKYYLRLTTATVIIIKTKGMFMIILSSQDLHDKKVMFICSKSRINYI